MCDSATKRSTEILETGRLKTLDEYIQENTSRCVLEMRLLKVWDPQKIATIWKEMEIEIDPVSCYTPVAKTV